MLCVYAGVWVYFVFPLLSFILNGSFILLNEFVYDVYLLIVVWYQTQIKFQIMFYVLFFYLHYMLWFVMYNVNTFGISIAIVIQRFDSRKRNHFNFYICQRTTFPWTTCHRTEAPVDWVYRLLIHTFICIIMSHFFINMFESSELTRMEFRTYVKLKSYSISYSRKIYYILI